MPSERITLRTVIAGAQVDRAAGVIRRVPIITAGVTKPSGNGQGPFDVDGVTLQQVADAINASGHLGSRVTHPELEGVDGIMRRVGWFSNATVEGSKVYADFTFGSYATEHERTKLCGLVKDEPKEIGVSIVDDTARIEPSTTAKTGMVLRVAKLDAIDWTDDPAANPAGMLSAHRHIALKGSAVFNQQQLDYLKGIGMAEDATADAIVAFVEGLDPEQKAALEALAEVAEDETPEAPAADPAIMAEGDPEEKPVMQSGKPKPTGVAMSQADIAKAAQDAIKADRQRQKQIRTIALKAGRDEKWIQQQIESNATVGEIALSAINSINRSPEDMPTSKVKVGADLNRDSINQAAQDAILLRAGQRNFVKFDEQGGVCLSADRRPEMRQAHERASEFRAGGHICEIGRRYLVALGYDKAQSMNKTQLAAMLMSRTALQGALPGVFLAHSTGDFPYLLADAMGKVLRGEYALAPHTWSMWCRQTTAPDFKTIKSIQLSEAADLAVIDEGDEYTYGSLTEGQETYALRTQGKGLKFTRQMLINDDLSAFDRVPRMMGRAAMRAVESEAIGILTANAALADAVALFATAHANLTTGTLSVASLGAARALLRKQTALGSSDPLELTPRYLLVPETIATTAQQLVSSTVDPAKNNATPNPFANTLEVIPSARLDSDSTAQWYLLADPAEIDTVECAFLEGEETPVVQEEDEFDTDCRKIKVRHTFRFKAIDYKGMVRSSGA